MKISFDPAKNEANIAKHGAALADGALIFDDADRILIETARAIDGENRTKVIGLVGGKLWTGVHVVRGDTVRFISVRRSNDGEERLYHRP